MSKIWVNVLVLPLSKNERLSSIVTFCSSSFLVLLKKRAQQGRKKMSVPDAAVNFLIENLRQVLTYNYHLIADVRGNIVKLQYELTNLRALMKDYEKYNHDSDYLKRMVHEIRTVLYEAEDAVDAYLLNAAVQKVRGWVSKTFHKITDYPKTLRDLGKQIEGISERVKKINEEKGTAINLLQLQAMDKIGQAPKPKEVIPN